MAAFHRDVDGFFLWWSYGAGGGNAVEKIELEAETKSWIDIGSGHVVRHKVEMTQKDSGVVVSNLHALNLLLVPTDILDILLCFCLALFISKVQDASWHLPFNTRP